MEWGKGLKSVDYGSEKKSVEIYGLRRKDRIEIEKQYG